MPEDVTWLREMTGRALFKMSLMQAEDRCSVPSEFESLIYSLAEWLGIKAEIEESNESN